MADKELARIQNLVEIYDQEDRDDWIEFVTRKFTSRITKSENDHISVKDGFF